MLSSDPFDILNASDAWGTRQVLRICEKLPREQFHQQFAIGLGSLHRTLTHMVGTMRSWTDRLAGRAVRKRLMISPEFPHLEAESKDRTPAELIELLDEAERDLMLTVRRIKDSNSLASTVVLEWPGSGTDAGKTKIYTFTRAAVIVHVTTHGYHHRAQCLNMLRQLGAPVPGVTEGYPELSGVDWQVETESPAVMK